MPGDFSLLDPPRIPGDDYTLRLTADQVDGLYGLFAGVRKVAPQSLEHPQFQALEAQVAYLKAIRNLASGEPGAGAKTNQILEFLSGKLKLLAAQIAAGKKP
jgi:hypothetical protein